MHSEYHWCFVWKSHGKFFQTNHLELTSPRKKMKQTMVVPTMYKYVWKLFGFIYLVTSTILAVYTMANMWFSRSCYHLNYWLKFLMKLQSQVHWATNYKDFAGIKESEEASVLLELSVFLKWLLSALSEPAMVSKPPNPHVQTATCTQPLTSSICPTPNKLH